MPARRIVGQLDQQQCGQIRHCRHDEEDHEISRQQRSRPVYDTADIEVALGKPAWSSKMHRSWVAPVIFAAFAPPRSRLGLPSGRRHITPCANHRRKTPRWTCARPARFPADAALTDANFRARMTTNSPTSFGATLVPHRLCQRTVSAAPRRHGPYRRSRLPVRRRRLRGVRGEGRADHRPAPPSGSTGTLARRAAHCAGDVGARRSRWYCANAFAATG